MFIVLVVIFPLVYLYLNRLKKFSIFFPMQARSIQSDKSRFNLKKIPNHFCFIAVLLSLILLIIALARPQKGFDHSIINNDGLDIFLVIDTSESMSQQDLIIDNTPVTRLEAVKQVISEFIVQRTNDRIGLVVFGTEAYAQSPLTSDHRVLKKFVEQLEIGMAGKKTTIGDAIGVASNRLSHFQAPSKVMILLTDGANSAGTVDPVLAAQAAKGLGIKIYTIGVAGQGYSIFGMPIGGSSVDDKLLKQISTITEGKYFEAKSTEDLHKVYQTIDQLETIEVQQQVFTRYKELYHLFTWGALIAFFLSQLFMLIGLGRLP